MGRLTRAYFDRDARAVAPELLNKLLVRRTPGAATLSARIVEVEAYCGADDPGSHAYRGATPRNRSMFGLAGRWYVYRSYGVHWCMNVVCGPGKLPHAVLVRAASPVTGLDTMYERRAVACRERDLCSGPGKLTQALAVDDALDGCSALSGALRIVDDGVAAPTNPGVSSRVGLSAGRGDTLAWRFYVRADDSISRPPSA